MVFCHVGGYCLFAEKDLQNAAVEQSTGHTRSLRGQAATARGMRGRGRGQTIGVGAGRGRGGRDRGSGTSARARGKGGSQRQMTKVAKWLTYVCLCIVCFVFEMHVINVLFSSFCMWAVRLAHIVLWAVSWPLVFTGVVSRSDCFRFFMLLDALKSGTLSFQLCESVPYMILCRHLKTQYFQQACQSPYHLPCMSDSASADHCAHL